MSKSLLLIVDDHEALRKSVASILEPAGYRTVEARTGEEALEVAKSNNVQAVLLDVFMPGKDGLWACAEIRKLEEYRDIPIVLCTAVGTKDAVEAALAHGASDYIIKPIDPALLLRKMQKLLEGGRPEGMERRGAPRRDVRLTMIAQTAGTEGGHVVFRASVLNISVGGVAFRHTPEPPVDAYAYEPHAISRLHPLYRYAANNADGEPVRLLVSIPEQSEPLRVLGKIVYIVPQGESEICGLQFTRVSPESHSRIAAFVTEEMREAMQLETGA